MLTLFKKEFRQHGAFAVAMIFLCLIFQSAYVEWWNLINRSFTPTSEAFLSIALLVTALYAGAAAALAYSTEHSENTFIFLRKLPVSWGTVACGKAGWVLCGTLLVLIGNLLLWLMFTATYQTGMPNNAEQIWGAVGIAIIEAFVWGLFWSTRCRSQVHALLATYLSAVASLYVVTYFFAIQSDDAGAMYAEVVPHRLVVASIVALGAVWGMSRWFSFEAKQPFTARLYPEKMTVRYPQKVQMPFSALVHHHVRHASILYPLGILSMFVWTIACIIGCIGTLFNIDISTFLSGDALWWAQTIFGCGFIGCVVSMGLFWATIFGHDQKNDSYQFLSRMGVPEGTVWWSRMLPAMICYVPVILATAVAWFSDLYRNVHHTRYYANYGWERFWEDFWLWAPLGFLCWLIPAAVGAFCSISFRSQMVAIALAAGGLALFYCWALFGVFLFACSPWWTAVPICIALLVASRIRAAYWLRETFTWRSRIIPLVPVLATMLVILAAIPPVRIYSVPNVSWSQIDAYFDQADLGDMPRAPEKRKAMIRHIAEHGTVPAEYEGRLAMLYRDSENWELNAFSGLTVDEYVLLMHMYRNNVYARFFTAKYWREKETEWSNFDRFFWWYSWMPWEAVRLERIMRLQVVAAFVESGSLQDKRAVAIYDLVKKRNKRSVGELDWSIWHMANDLDGRVPCFRQLQHVFRAMNKWYAEHDNTLPESLDELVEQGYLSAFPEHPWTGELMQFHRDAPPPEGIIPSHVFSRGILGMGDDWGKFPRQQLDAYSKMLKAACEALPESGGTYLQLGKWAYVIVEQTAVKLKYVEDNDNNNDDAFDAILGTAKE